MTVSDMYGWLMSETRDAIKALDLRIKDATTLVSSYESGKISPGELESELRKYDERWGEALYGTTVGKGSTDEEILRAIDSARRSDGTSAGTHVDRLKINALSGKKSSAL